MSGRLTARLKGLAYGWRIAVAFGLMAVVQLINIGLKRGIFTFIERTDRADFIVGLIIELSFVALLLSLVNRRKLFPTRLKLWWWLGIGLTALMFLSSVYFHLSGGLPRLLKGALLTPAYEELLFRALIWELLDADEHRWGFVLNALLFGLWHLGYAEQVAWRMALRGAEGSLASMMLRKVVTGGALGRVFAFLQKKTGRTLAPFLAHCFINSFGG